MALKLKGSSSGYVALDAPATAGDNTLTLPVNNGSANQLLKTDGSGNLSWTNDNSGVSLSGSTDNTIATVTGANALQGEANLTFDGTNLDVNKTGGANITVGSGGSNVDAKWTTGATGTQWGSTTNDWAAIMSNNTVRMHIANDGKIGIGTTSPTFTAGGGVHLKGAGTDFTSYRVTASSNTGIDFSQASDGKGYVYNRDNADLIVGTNNTERLRIDSSGNITAVNTTSGGQSVTLKIGASNASGTNDGIIKIVNGGTGNGVIQWDYEGNANRAQIYVYRSTQDLIFTTAGSERCRITSGGSLLVGTTSYGGGGVVPALYISNSAGRQLKIHNTSDSTSSIQLTNSGTGEGDDNGLQIAVLSDSTVWFNNQENEPIRFAQGGSEKARFTTDGTLCVSCTGGNVGRTDEGISLNADGAIVTTRDGVHHYIKSLATGGYTGIQVQSANTVVGSMTFNSGGTAWNTTSDYRLKENQVAISDGITRVKTLKPYRFNFKNNPSKILDGFYAHEVTAVPEAISGTKDAVATEADATAGVSIGDPIYQQIDQSKLVPLLTAALQEAIGKIETLETKVAALESA